MARPFVRRLAAPILTAVIAGCAAQTPSASPPASPEPSVTVTASPAASAAAVLPPLSDVGFYRGDALRSSIQPGPGPIEQPTLAWEHDLGDHTSTIPILVGGLVITGTDDGRLVALDAHSGAERWAVPLDGSFVGSPASDGQVIVAPFDGGVLAVDRTGTELWRSSIGQENTRPTIVDGVVYVGSTDGRVIGLDVKDGSERWSWNGPQGVSTRVDLVQDGIAYVSTFDGRLIAVGLGDAETRWSYRSRAAVVGAPVIAGDTIYVSNSQDDSPDPVGEIAAIATSTGDVRWRFSTPTGLQVIAGPIRDGLIYVTSTDDGLYAMRDSGDRPEIVWSSPQGPRSQFPAALVGDLLYVPGIDGAISAVRTSDGAVQWATDPGGGETRGPLVSGGLVLLQRDQRGRGVISALAEPSLVALLPQPPTATEPSPGPVAANPFTTEATFGPDVTTVGIPIGMDAGPDGMLYVLDNKPSVVVIDPATGKQVRTWGRQGSGDGEFDLRRPDEENVGIGDIDVGHDGLVYVADGANHRVQVFRPDGSYVRQFGRFGSGDGQFARVATVVVDSTGAAYVQDADLGLLSKFDKDGAFIWRIGGKDGPVEELRNAYKYRLLDDRSLLTFDDFGGQGFLIDTTSGDITGRWGPDDIGDSAETSRDEAGHVFLFQYVPQTMRVLSADGKDLGRYEYPASPTPAGTIEQAWGPAYWPAPVFPGDGFGYSFSREGLVRLSVALPT